MSNSGPPPTWNRNCGAGCQRSGPGTWNRASAVCGAPMLPASMIRREVWSPAPSSVSGAQPTRTPASAACSSSAPPVAVSRASGFSTQTCLPAAMDSAG